VAAPSSEWECDRNPLPKARAGTGYMRGRSIPIGNQGNPDGYHHLNIGLPGREELLALVCRKEHSMNPIQQFFQHFCTDLEAAWPSLLSLVLSVMAQTLTTRFCLWVGSLLRRRWKAWRVRRKHCWYTNREKAVLVHNWHRSQLKTLLLAANRQSAQLLTAAPARYAPE
jgi:hypothetical protein